MRKRVRANPARHKLEEDRTDLAQRLIDPVSSTE